MTWIKSWLRLSNSKNKNDNRQQCGLSFNQDGKRILPADASSSESATLDSHPDSKEEEFSCRTLMHGVASEKKRT